MKSSSFLILLLLGASIAAADPAPAESLRRFDVREFGAKGDGITKDTAALQKALDACADAGGGIVVVSRGHFLTGSLVMRSRTTLQIEGWACLMGSPDIADYPLVKVRWEGEFAQGHRAFISAEKADHIAIRGPGSIFGPPANLGSLRNPRGPSLIELTECTDVLLEGFTTQYQRLWCIHPLFCRDLTVRDLTIRSSGGNGDGIDVDSCSGVLIEGCDINAGDDAIALKSGRGLAAARLGRPTENVVIRHCTLASSIFAGLAFGSEMSGGIRNVRVEHCVIAGRQNGISIKSRNGRGGFFENITGEHLLVFKSPTFLAIELLKKGIQASDPVPGTVEQWARTQGIRFSHVEVRDVGTLVEARSIPADRPIDGLTLTDISGTCRQAIVLSHAKNVVLGGISVSGYAGPLTTFDDVSGTGLEAPAAPIPTEAR